MRTKNGSGCQILEGGQIIKQEAAAIIWGQRDGREFSEFPCSAILSLILYFL